MNPLTSVQDNALSVALLSLSRNGILVLEAIPGPAQSFRIIQANTRVQQLVEGLPSPVIGAYLEQFPAPFNSSYLLQQLQQVLGQGEAAHFQLINPAVQAGSFPVYDCQLAQVSERLLVLSLDVITYLPGDGNFQEQLLETIPTGLVVFKVIRNENNEIVDFQAVFCNQTGADISRQSREEIMTRPISERYSNMQTYELFHQYKAVVTTGEPHHQLQYLAKQDIWLDISVVRFGDGLLVTFQDVTLGQQTTSLLESVMSSSPAAIRYYESIRDEAGQIIDFRISTGNELAAYRPYRPYDSTTGRRLLEMYPYLETNGIFQRYVKVTETGESDHFETSLHLNGRLVWFDCTAVPHGNGFVLTTLDITSRKQAQLALQEQAHLLQTVLDNSLTGITWLKTVYNPTGGITDFIIEKINVPLARILQRPPQLIEGQALSSLMPHQMTNGLFERYATVAQTSQPQRFDWSNADASIWYDISVVPFADGLIITFMDITAIKLAQLDLKRQSELIAGVLNSSPNSILVLEAVEDPAKQVIDLRIVLINPATIRMLPALLSRNLASDDVLGRLISEFVPADKLQATLNDLVHVVNTRQPIRQQVDYPDLGISYDYDIDAFRNGVLIMTTDITPLRQYQKKLEENNAALSRSNEHLQQFAYVASHDLQEPLRKVRSFGDMLVANYVDRLGPDGVDLLQRMQSAATRMDTLIRDLLAYSRLSIQERAFEPQELNQLVAEVLSDLEITVQQKGAILEIAHLPTVRGDALQLRQLFQNLLSNALKFVQPDIKPRIRINCQVVKRSEVDGLPLTVAGQSFYRISVTDNGIGFGQESVNQIFQLFQRLHSRSKYSGTGMGLAICKKIVENHRGFITAESRPNQGAMFTFFLPMAGITGS